LGVIVGATLMLSVTRRRARRIRLAGLVAVVTGGGRGLGLAITRELLARGCSVAICGRDPETIERAAWTLQQQGGDVFGMACDTSQPEAVERFIQAVLTRFGRIDLLVNNAGQCFTGPASELSAADMASALRNIFWSQFYPTLAVLPQMRQRRFGRIANVTSFAGKVAIPHQAAYTAAKHAATGWSLTLASELARDGIRVSTITPPPIRNGAPLAVHFHGDVEAEFSWFTRTLTSRLTAVSADRVARSVVDALRDGDGERAVGVTSWLLARAQGLAPGLVAGASRAIERWMPAHGAPGTTSRTLLGAEVALASTDAGVQRLADRARAQKALYLP
jgi:NAD(P)-dependent dehydrogenase (short-subunit alcohol dehydrogenase family)